MPNTTRLLMSIEEVFVLYLLTHNDLKPHPHAQITSNYLQILSNC